MTWGDQADGDLHLQNLVLATEHDLALDGILVVDDQDRVLSFNQRFAIMWGIPADVLATRSDTAMLQAVVDKLADPQLFLDKVRHLYEHHDETSRDEVVLADGRIFDRYSAPMHADGRYYGRVWYFRDATEAKAAEATLRLARDRAEQYLDIAEVILLALDTEGRVTLINRKGCSVLGWEEHELLGRDWIETCLPARDRAALRSAFNKLLDQDFSPIENPVLTRSGEQRLIEWRNTVLRDGDGRVIGTLSSGQDVTARRRNEERLRQAMEDTVGALAATVEARDPYTSGHQHRVAELATAIARGLGLNESRVHSIYLASVVHDIGKISIPAELLTLPRALTPVEATLLQTHVEAGYDILKGIDFPWPIAEFVRQHHERLDGSGYPLGLRSDALHLESKIIAVADIVEAMAADRPYRFGKGIDAALAEIESGLGVRYDSDVAEMCLRLFRTHAFAFS